MTTSVRRRMFAKICPRINAWAEAHGGAEHRVELLAGVGGRVIEVGAGTALRAHPRARARDRPLPTRRRRHLALPRRRPPCVIGAARKPSDADAGTRATHG
jgi:hypothetical protein